MFTVTAQATIPGGWRRRWGETAGKTAGQMGKCGKTSGKPLGKYGNVEKLSENQQVRKMIYYQMVGFQNGVNAYRRVRPFLPMSEGMKIYKSELWGEQKATGRVLVHIPMNKLLLLFVVVQK